MKMPNFYILGAAKSGTTTLYHYLNQHPQVFMSPIKETNFFAFQGEKPTFKGVKVNKSTVSYQQEIITDLSLYRQQFSAVNKEIAIGESCPSYLYIPKAAENIKRHTPQAKLIVILRNPIERAYSNFLHNIRDRSEYYDDFSEGIEAESGRINDGWWWGFHYVRVGLYYEQVKRYFDLFDRSQVKVYLFDQLKNNEQLLLNDICQFLEIEYQVSFDNSKLEKHNSTGVPVNQFLDNLIKDSSLLKKAYQTIVRNKKIRKNITNSINRFNPLVKPDLDREIKDELLPLFREDILKLQDLIRQDLSPWLSSENSKNLVGLHK